MLRVNVYDWGYSGGWELIGLWFKAECGHWHYNDIKGNREREFRQRRLNLSGEFIYHRPLNHYVQASQADVVRKKL